MARTRRGRAQVRPADGGVVAPGGGRRRPVARPTACRPRWTATRAQRSMWRAAGRCMERPAGEVHRAPRGRLAVGAALGFFSRAARARGWAARGIERSAYAAERAASSGVPVVRGDFLSAALVPASFTAVTLLDVLEHTADPRAYVRRARACLRPGGVLAIETADLAAPFARLAGRRYHFFTPPNHLTYFTRATLARLLAEEGFADPGFFRVGKWVTLRRLVYHVYTRAPRPALGRLVRVVERSGFARLAVPVNLGDDVLALARAAG